MNNLWLKWTQINLIKRILVGLSIGIILAILAPKHLVGITILGTLFVGALKAVAPVLVFILVTSAISQHKTGQQTNIKSILILYLIGTFAASFLAVIASFLFPLQLIFTQGVNNATPPSNVIEVFKNIFMSIISNPISALYNANYIGILSWATMLGLALRQAQNTTKTIIEDLAQAVSKIVRWIINFAPFGIMGLVFEAISTSGIASLYSYLKLVLLLVGCMAFMALVVNPFIVYVCLRKNPYPLVFKCLKQSGITAFFTRSSAANIPVNMALCEEVNIDKDTYSISIPLGATINMEGAAITIAILTLAAVNTLNIPVDFSTAILLSAIAAISACGASGVAGGSLLLIPLACSLFGISNDIAMQVVGVGFIIGVIQDSCETALNSSTDALFTITAEFAKTGRRL